VFFFFNSRPSQPLLTLYEVGKYILMSRDISIMVVHTSASLVEINAKKADQELVQGMRNGVPHFVLSRCCTVSDMMPQQLREFAVSLWIGLSFLQEFPGFPLGLHNNYRNR